MHLDLPPKLYYSIGEVSKAFKVNASLIRFWEKEFSDLNPKKNSKGTRRYSLVDIEKLQIIHHLVKEKGYTLEGAKEQLKALDKNFEIIKKLEKIIGLQTTIQPPDVGNDDEKIYNSMIDSYIQDLEEEGDEDDD